MDEATTLELLCGDDVEIITEIPLKPVGPSVSVTVLVLFDSSNLTVTVTVTANY